MTSRASLPRRTAIALMRHAAWVLPAARGPWAQAMQHELPQIENELEALRWAGGCVLASYVERGRAIAPTPRRMKMGFATLLVVAAIGGASWWAGQRPHLTPGNHHVFHEDSTAGGLLGFLIFLVAAMPALAGLFALHDGNFQKASRAGRICAIIVVPYLTAVALVSLLTPRTIVNIGDSYCYDLWCLGVNQVSAVPSGQATLYKAEVSIFTDSSHPHRLPAERAKEFFYVLDDRGRRYPLLQATSFAHADIAVRPGESVKSSLAFLARPNAQRLYLMGNTRQIFLPWIYLYFGSDISLLHRSALLRIL